MGEMLDRVDLRISAGMYRVVVEDGSIYWIDIPPITGDGVRVNGDVTRVLIGDAEARPAIDGRWRMIGSLVSTAGPTRDSEPRYPGMLIAGTTPHMHTYLGPGKYGSYQWVDPGLVVTIERVEVHLSARTTEHPYDPPEWGIVNPIALALFPLGVALDNIGARGVICERIGGDGPGAVALAAAIDPSSQDLILALALYPNP